jgi:transposase
MPVTIVTVGIDLAKNVFAVHGVNHAGKPELVKHTVQRAKLLNLIASLPPCLIGMEACSGAHHWAREFEKLGHTVRIMAPKFVAPYRLGGKHGKNDAADAAAICEAVARPNMRFVPIKTIEQQGQLFVHRAHQGYVSERVALINRIRGLLSELGIVLPQSFKAFQLGVHTKYSKTCPATAIKSSVTCSMNLAACKSASRAVNVRFSRWLGKMPRRCD